MRKFSLLLGLALFGLPASATAQEAKEMAHEAEHEAMSAEVTEAIEAQVAAMAEAFNAGDAAAAASFYASDAISYPPGAAALEGRAAIQAHMAAGFAQMAGMQMTFTTNEVHAMHEHAVETGGYVVDAADGSHIDHGKYITYWTNTGDGWKISRDMWNSSMGGGQ